MSETVLSGYEINQDAQSDTTRIKLRVLHGNNESIYNSAVSSGLFDVLPKDEIIDLLFGLVDVNNAFEK